MIEGERKIRIINKINDLHNVFLNKETDLLSLPKESVNMDIRWGNRRKKRGSAKETESKPPANPPCAINCGIDTIRHQSLVSGLGDLFADR